MIAVRHLSWQRICLHYLIEQLLHNILRKVATQAGKNKTLEHEPLATYPSCWKQHPCHEFTRSPALLFQVVHSTYEQGPWMLTFDTSMSIACRTWRVSWFMYAFWYSKNLWDFSEYAITLNAQPKPPMNRWIIEQLLQSQSSFCNCKNDVGCEFQ